MVDIAKSKGIDIDFIKLSKELHLPIYQLVLVWLAAFFVNIIGNIIFNTKFNSNTVIEFLVSGLIFLITVIINYRKLTKKSSSSCGGCSGCSSCTTNLELKNK